jgi:VanZ family protein
LLAILIATAYGISDEIHQLWTPQRSADWRDVVADASGAALGAAAMSLVAMRWLKFRG